MKKIANELDTAIKHWWVFIIAGLLSIMAGIGILLKPKESYLALTFLFGLVIITSGFARIYIANVNGNNLEEGGWTLTAGVFEVIIGISLLIFSFGSMITLPIILGFWVMLRAVFMIGTAIDLKGLNVYGWGWILSGGIIDIVLAFLVLYSPSTGIVTVRIISSLAFIVGGIFNFVLAFRFKNIKSSH